MPPALLLFLATRLFPYPSRHASSSSLARLLLLLLLLTLLFVALGLLLLALLFVALGLLLVHSLLHALPRRFSTSSPHLSLFSLRNAASVPFSSSRFSPPPPHPSLRLSHALRVNALNRNLFQSARLWAQNDARDLPHLSRCFFRAFQPRRFARFPPHLSSAAANGLFLPVTELGREESQWVSRKVDEAAPDSRGSFGGRKSGKARTEQGKRREGENQGGEGRTEGRKEGATKLRNFRSRLFGLCHGRSSHLPDSINDPVASRPSRCQHGLACTCNCLAT